MTAPTPHSVRSVPPTRGVYRLGMLGGMFDPPHLGHIAALKAAVAGARLDRCLVVPAGAPPHRPAAAASGAQRLAMTFDAFVDVEEAAPSDIELQRADDGIPTYTVDTLEELAAQPDELGFTRLQMQLVLVIGADHAQSFTTWHRWQDIIKRAELAVVTRPDLADDDELGGALDQLRMAGASITECPMSSVDASSSAIRAAARSADTATLARMLPHAMIERICTEYGGIRASNM